MTAVVCDRMRAAALGNVWSGHPEQDRIDQVDAERIEAAWVKLDRRSQKILRKYWVLKSTPDFICRRLAIRRVPASAFFDELRRAEGALKIT